MSLLTSVEYGERTTVFDYQEDHSRFLLNIAERSLA